YGIHCNTLL
nr:RecName: Full=Transaldolase-3; AltName: Full=Transaldolase III [Cyberlindnera jadinii]